ncbi:Glycosyltransferase family 17 [Flavobacterium segetis]|uniref:Glycosyltransferase family 17 n=1 Tax=Flavobacterium segetis TaxID=271157 RepID=A0A1M5IGD1_9FLAO|nr:hypothetical protein [Flavobacterium segetis]SHG27119.1 Glycosyltransferase family 17 [Flavobacterium segetis]
MDKKIVSTFMFSDSHEQELLWLKFNVEDSFITEWIITESKYTFQGKMKPMFLIEILKQSRFQKFIQKIHCIELDENFNFQFEPNFKDLLKRKIKRRLNINYNKNYELVPYAELASFFSEINQRGACLNYLKSKYSKDDIIITCDTDEIFDFTGEKMNYFINAVSKYKTPFYIKRNIYCYDFDNYSNRLRYSPIVKLGDLISKQSFHHVRHPLPQKRIIAESDQSLAFEYTFCFSRDSIIKKLTSFAHVTDLDSRGVDFCLDNNIALINPDKIDNAFIRNSESFFETITISEKNTPLFLINNMKDFETNVVNENYLLQRKKNRIEHNN